ncbi:MAG: hypothetical protein M3Q52_02070 [Pseudomonadota bacterium]|nr:hypothetical protein [Pseudomonadota bacterium]
MLVPLLGFEDRTPGLPRTISVPNLNADRPVGLARRFPGLNVRRLMYQTLIWTVELSNEPSGLGAPLNAERVQGAANALIDGVRRDPELDRDFL